MLVIPIYFDELVSLVLSLASVDVSLTAYANHGNFTEYQNRDSVIYLFGHESTYVWLTYQLMNNLIRDRWPSQITIQRHNGNQPPRTHAYNQNLSNIGFQNLVKN